MSPGRWALDQVVINAARTKIGERTVEGGTVGTEDHISTALRRRVAPFQPPACRSFSGRHGDGRGRGKALENAPRATAHALGRIEHADAATLSLVKAGQAHDVRAIEKTTVAVVSSSGSDGSSSKMISPSHGATTARRMARSFSSLLGEKRSARRTPITRMSHLR